MRWIPSNVVQAHLPRAAHGWGRSPSLVEGHSKQPTTALPALHWSCSLVFPERSLGTRRDAEHTLGKDVCMAWSLTRALAQKSYVGWKKREPRVVEWMDLPGQPGPLESGASKAGQAVSKASRLPPKQRDRDACTLAPGFGSTATCLVLPTSGALSASGRRRCFQPQLPEQLAFLPADPVKDKEGPHGLWVLESPPHPPTLMSGESPWT